MIDILMRGGSLMIPLYACSIFALALILWKTLQLGAAIHALDGTPQELLQRKPTLLAPLIEAIEAGAGEQEVAFAGTRQLRKLGQGLGSLNLISTISPLLGLTGTVTGMITAFQSIAAAGARADVTVVASGIWEALITTAAGLLIAIPAHIAYHYLDRRMEAISLTLEETATVLYERKHEV